jgi:hypothetical protein
MIKCMKWLLRLYSVLMVASAVFSNVSIADAQTKKLCPPAFASLCNIDLGGQAGGIVGTVMVTLMILAIVICLFFLIFGGYRFITAAGDQGKTAQARTHIVAAIVGLIVSLLAFFIVNIVTYVITGKGIGNLSIPKL